MRWRTPTGSPGTAIASGSPTGRVRPSRASPLRTGPARAGRSGNTRARDPCRGSAARSISTASTAAPSRTRCSSPEPRGSPIHPSGGYHRRDPSIAGPRRCDAGRMALFHKEPMTEYIEIRGARENNLKDVDLRIPKREITIFTGVSGSGKSSIVFDTLATEAQRQLFENFSYFVRNFLPTYPQPQADSIENLSMAVIVDQKRLGGGSTSTVGTITDIYTLLRLLFSRIGRPAAGGANAFSFNDPQGMCPECSGSGRKSGFVPDDFLD